jgi:preprotein translocase subunit SecA
VARLEPAAVPRAADGRAALHFGNIAEMKTGEGKTLTVLPAYLNALAARACTSSPSTTTWPSATAEWMGRVHRFLGLDVGVILSQMTPERRAAYAADITYGTNNEFGFDYLRDNMAHSLEDLVQRGHNFAIVDEVDSILIDEARTPLIISGPADGASNWYTEFARSPAAGEGRPLRGRREEAHHRRARAGIEKVEDQLGIDNLYEAANSPLVSYLNNAIKAKELFQRDKDYIVRDGEVMIVDEFTGRILPAAATTRACTRPSRPRRASRSRPRTRRWPRSRCRTTSGCTTSSPA